MTYIPDTREEGPYCDKNIKDPLNREFVKGYDWAVEQLKNWFYNRDCVPSGFDSEETPAVASIMDNDKEADALSEILETWLESQRDELVVSILDEEYVESEDKAFMNNESVKGE